MKLKQLQGVWKEAAETYQQSFAADVAGWYYSRCHIGETIDREAVLKELQEYYPEISGLELNPFTIIISVKDAGFLRIKYRSTGMRIGYTYKIVGR